VRFEVDSEPKGLCVRSKIWIEDANEEVVFGSGRLFILEAVAKHGSINAAAHDLHMSYRAVWGKIRATEKRLGQPLLSRKTGGAQGGGSELTPFARDLIDRYGKLQAIIRNSTDELFEDLFVPAMREK